MIAVHSGFDGLDIALKTTPPDALITRLTDAQEFATWGRSDHWTSFNGIRMRVAESGGRGGYKFRFSTGPDGATWFVKEPHPGDPWGVRVSFNSRGLALKGLEATRRELEETCHKLGLVIDPDGVRIGRVDFAVDVFDPHFDLVPEHFVMHARTRRKTHADLDHMQTHGPSGRFTSVTIGKQPGRQVIVYDKREEVLEKNKVEWPMIWSKNLEKMGRAALNPDDPALSQVWRVELRLGKKALRERAEIKGWASFYENLEAEMLKLVHDVSLRSPTGDTNRSRWPLHPLWRVTLDVLEKGIFDHVADVAPEEVADMNLRDKQLEFERSIASFAVTLAVLYGCRIEQFDHFLLTLPKRILNFLHRHPNDLQDRFAKAQSKYHHLLGGYQLQQLCGIEGGE